MQYKNLGQTGINVSRLCIGMMSYGNSQDWMLEIDEARPIIERAIDSGINFFDTANVYSRGRSEEITGELLENYRDDVVIATKIRFNMGKKPNDKGLNRYHLAREINNSLNRLRTDFVELYQIHRWDYSTDIKLVMKSLNHLINSGLVLHIGASSMYAWELAKAQHTADSMGLEKFSTMQNHYNAIYREEEREVIPFCLDQKMGIIPWSPLARGFLSGKYGKDNPDSKRIISDPYLKGRYFRDNDFDILKEIQNGAKENNISIAQMSLAWILNKNAVTSPIIGVTKIDHLEEALEILELKIDQHYFKNIDKAYIPRPIIGHSYDQPDKVISIEK